MLPPVVKMSITFTAPHLYKLKTQMCLFLAVLKSWNFFRHIMAYPLMACVLEQQEVYEDFSNKTFLSEKAESKIAAFEGLRSSNNYKGHTKNMYPLVRSLIRP